MSDKSVVASTNLYLEELELMTLLASLRHGAVARGNPPPSGEEGASDFTASSRWARAIASIIAPLDSRGYPPPAGLETEPQCNAPAARAPGDTRGPARGAASRIASKASAPFIRFST